MHVINDGYFYLFLSKNAKVNIRPIGENSPILVTLGRNNIAGTAVFTQWDYERLLQTD
jgi:hypothetical protein